MRKLLLVIEDSSVKLREILTDEVRQELLVLDQECKEKRIDITPEMVSEIVGHRCVEAHPIEVERERTSAFEELMKTFSPEMMLAEIQSIRMGKDYLDCPVKPSKKIPRNRRFNSPDWNF